MDSIEASEFPLVFKADQQSLLQAPEVDGRISVRTATRALAGMQKEAIVCYGHQGSVWRTVCDEGPWLNGTDLAPFPLGFFSAGLVASYLSEYLSHAKHQGLVIRQLQVMVDNHYSMEGSLLKGTMTGSALPVHVTFSVNADADINQLNQLSYLAVATSPADAYLREAQRSTFSLNRNSEQVKVAEVLASAGAAVEDPETLFNKTIPSKSELIAEDILEKLEAVESLGGDKLGAIKSAGNVGLSENQKRQLHVRGVGKLRSDGMKEVRVACFTPVGSVFQLLSDDSILCGGQERAPSGLVYLAAGLSYCFMTQLGRYAQVAKQELQSYRIVQDAHFSLPYAISAKQEPATSSAVDTQVFLQTRESLENTQRLLRMGEQTCYLHAACRTAIKTRIQTAKI